MEVVIETLWTLKNETLEVVGYQIIVDGKVYARCEDWSKIAGILTDLKEEEAALLRFCLHSKI